MLYDCKRISCWIDRRLPDFAGPDYDATISFGLPFESEDSQYGKSRLLQLLKKWSALELLWQTTPRPFARFLFANNQLAEQFRDYRL